MAALTSELETTARATARASASSRAPVTAQVMSVVAPSPSAACWRARSRATASIPRPSAVAASPSAATGAFPAAPPARTKTVSFVLVSPSTESWSQVRAAAGRRSPASTAGSTAASVRTIASIVAIRGWIIPTPLAMPETRTGTGRPSGPGSSIDVVAAFARESVVRSASAAAASPSSVAVRPPFARRAIPGMARSSGSRVPMIPVDIARVRATGTPSARGERLDDEELVLGTGRSGGGIRAARRRDDAGRPAVAPATVRGRRPQVRPAHDDRRRGECVGGEHRGHGRRLPAGRTRRPSRRWRCPAAPTA